jgi:opacity protein-like surface antigen
MKTKSVRQWLGLVTLASVGAASANAADVGFFLGGSAGVNFVDNIEVGAAAPVNSIEFAFDPGFRFDVSGGYTFLANDTLTLAAAGEIGFIYNSLERGDAANGVSLPIDGDFYQVPLLGKVVLTVMPDSQFSPFASVGVGGVYSRLDVNSVGGDESAESSGDETDPAFQGQLGMKYKFNESCLVGLSYKCLIVFAEDIDEYFNHSVSLTFGVRF